MIHTKYSLGVGGKRNVRRPKLRWRDVTRNDMIKLGIQEDDAKDRNRWSPMYSRNHILETMMKEKEMKERKNERNIWKREKMF